MQVSINYAVALWEFRMNCASGSLHTRYKIVNNMACALDVVPVKTVPGQYKKEGFIPKQQASVVLS